MDPNDLWEENKRFLGWIAAAAVAFLVGLLTIRSLFGEELAANRRAKARLERQLAEARYDGADRETARAENAALEGALGELAEEVEFLPRSDFALDPDGGSAVNQYHRTVARVRESLLTVAGRANLYLDADLGLPDLSPSDEGEIARHLDALDAIDRAVRLAVATGVARVDDVRIRVDPRRLSRKGTGPVERTRVELELAGSGLSLLRFLRATQRPGEHPDLGRGHPLTVDSFELRPSRNRPGESTLVLALDLVRLHGPARPGEAERS